MGANHDFVVTHPLGGLGLQPAGEDADGQSILFRTTAFFLERIGLYRTMIAFAAIYAVSIGLFAIQHRYWMDTMRRHLP